MAHTLKMATRVLSSTLPLKEFKKQIKEDKFSLSKQDDIKIVTEKWSDLIETEKKKLSKMCITYWNSKNTKLYNLKDLLILEYYLKNFNKSKVKNYDISITDDYKFNFITYNGDNIRQENIFKLNLFYIVQKLKEYYKDADIGIFYERHTWCDKQIKNTQSTYKHDVLINVRISNGEESIQDENNLDKMTYDQIKDSFEIVLEYFEKKHNRFSDGDKEISVKQTTDEYSVFNEKSDDFSEYYEKTIYSLMKYICASTNNKYELSKVLYYMNCNSKKKANKLTIDYFNRIIDYKKSGTFNFINFFDEIKPRDINTDEYFTVDEFIDFLDGEYDIQVELDDDNNCEFKTFTKIISKVSDESINSVHVIDKYRQTYFNAIDVLNDASDEIINLINNIRNKRYHLPVYVKNLLKYHGEALAK
jgi:hypothetical protein